MEEGEQAQEEEAEAGDDGAHSSHMPGGQSEVGTAQEAPLMPGASQSQANRGKSISSGGEKEDYSRKTSMATENRKKSMATENRKKSMATSHTSKR